MTPVERLQAAIDKLETLKANSTPGTWRAWDSFSSDRAPRVYITGNNSGPSDGNRVARVENRENQDADLIETLHRTIDAQLAILRVEARRRKASVILREPLPESLRDGYDEDTLEGWLATLSAEERESYRSGVKPLVLALADAILGSDP